MTTAWTEVALGELVTEAKPGFASGHDLDDGVFQFRMNNLTRDGRLDLTKRRRVPRNTPKIESCLLEPGDVLFNATNSPDLVGKTAYFDGLDEPAVFSNHFVRLRAQPSRSDGRFLARWLQLQWERGLFRARAKQWVNQATFGRDSLLNLRLRVPPVDEQRRIAAILDAADELRAKRRESLRLLDTLTESIFLNMFGDPASNPHGFPIEPLTAVVADGTSVTYGIVQAGAEYEGGVPYIRTGDIVEGRIAVDQLRKTKPSLAARFERSRVSCGDIVMSIRATVGTTAMVPPLLDGANLTQGTARIAPGPRATGPYLLAFLRTASTQRWIQRQVKGATFREITLARLRELPVMLAPVETQGEFVRRVNHVAQSTAMAAFSANQLDALFASLQHRAFRGEL